MTDELDDFDAWLEDYRPYIASTKVCGRADLFAEFRRANEALVAANVSSLDMLSSAEVNEAKRAVQAVEAEIAASEKEFTFQGISHRDWQDLKREHPATGNDAADGYEVDMATWVPAVIAATSHRPKLTAERVKKMAARLPTEEYEKLFQAALEANGKVVGAPKSDLAARIERSLQNGGSSTTALPDESLDPSSSDGNDDLSPGTSTTTPAD